MMMHITVFGHITAASTHTTATNATSYTGRIGEAHIAEATYSTHTITIMQGCTGTIARGSASYIANAFHPTVLFVQETSIR